MRSLERNTNAPIVIFDDHSTDQDSVDALNRLKDQYEVVRPPRGTEEQRTGGLYGNINFAMDIARQRGAEWTLMIQDDQQMVRPIRGQDLDTLRSAAEMEDASGIVYAAFPKTQRGRRLNDDSYEPITSELFAPNRTTQG